MYIISAVLEKGQLKVALYDKSYKVLAKKEGSEADLGTVFHSIMSEGGVKPTDVEYVGIASDRPIASGIEKHTGIKCYETSIISARALGEAYLSGDVNFLAMLKVDDTVECGIVIDKKIYPDVNVAHMVVAFGGYECACGRRGCFEAYASNTGLKRIAAATGADTHKELFAMNTPEAENAKKLYVEYLASGIVDVINLFQPNDMVLDGPFTEVGEALMQPLMEIILREQYTHSMPNKCNVRFANKEADTALLGAALLGR